MRTIAIALLIPAFAICQQHKPKLLNIFSDMTSKVMKIGDVGYLPVAVEPPGSKPTVDLTLYKIEMIKDDLVLLSAEHFQTTIGKRYFAIKVPTKDLKEGQIYTPRGAWTITGLAKFDDKERAVLEPERDDTESMTLHEKQRWYVVLNNYRAHVEKVTGTKEKAKDQKRWQEWRDELWAKAYTEYYKLTETEVKKILNEGDKANWEKKPGDAEKEIAKLEEARNIVIKKKSQYIVLFASRAKIDTSLPKPKNGTIKDIAKWQSLVDAEWAKTYAELKLKGSEAKAILGQGDKENWPTK